MNLVIIDDDVLFGERILKFCKAYLKSRTILAEPKLITSFHEASRMQFGENDMPDILLLDIQMPEMSGLEIKEKLEEKNVYIIFISAYPENMPAAFGRNVIAFIEKPVFEDKLQMALDKATQYCRQYFAVELESGFCVKSRDIKFIQSSHIYTCVHLQDGTKMDFRRSLSEWETRLDPAFFLRISRSCIVNFAWVKDCRGSRVEIRQSGECFSIGRGRQKEFQKQYALYKRKMARYL